MPGKFHPSRLGSIMPISRRNMVRAPQPRSETCRADSLCTPGDVIYLNALGQSIVVLNSQQAALDLLQRRAAIYSDRPQTVVVGELYVLHAEL